MRQKRTPSPSRAAPAAPPHPVLPRREAIRAGSIGLLGLGMNHLAALRTGAEARGAGDSATRPRARSVIYVFLSGGLSQIDSFDPKPEGPAETRGEFRDIPTRTPGVHVCEHLPMLAGRSHLWALCRSLTHGSNEHSQGHHMMLTGRSELPPGFDARTPKEGDWPSIASVAGRALQPRHNLPPAIVLPEKLVHRTGRVIPGQFAGQMGPRHDPFFVETSDYDPVSYGAYPDYLFHHRRGKEDGSKHAFEVPSFTLPEGLTLGRLRRRLDLLGHLDAQQRHLEETAAARGADRYRAMALSLLSDPATKRAFDVHGADPRLQDRYGRNAFGWSLLMARQLVEAGVSLVQVNLGNNETWDTHEAAFPNLKNFLLPPFDRAVSALLDDLQERGLLEETLVVVASEFGRTPRIFKINGANLPGRDHWGAVQSVLFAGGGVRGGNVVGSTDPTGGYPASEPQRPEDFAATIYRALAIPPSARWVDHSGRPHHFYFGNPIEGLFS